MGTSRDQHRWRQRPEDPQAAVTLAARMPVGPGPACSRRFSTEITEGACGPWKKRWGVTPATRRQAAATHACAGSATDVERLMRSVPAARCSAWQNRDLDDACGDLGGRQVISSASGQAFQASRTNRANLHIRTAGVTGYHCPTRTTRRRLEGLTAQEPAGVADRAASRKLTPGRAGCAEGPAGDRRTPD